MCIEKNKKIVEFDKKHVFKPFTIDKLDIGDIISNITMIFLRLGKQVLGMIRKIRRSIDAC
ncbi:hypothetical protein DXA97_05110 [Clostridium sp. OF09-36]|nr:hypothetical protein DW922_08605 [Clostridium sp. AM42-4]RHV89037.1 hypothetical protein DXA97_05110 [Clostridium sp. OF09-36]HBM47578.1 hypothetical protein [Lachnoclostridium sp.]